jgi:hypothetical protein
VINTLTIIVRTVKNMRLRWAEHVARIGRQECMQNIGAEMSSKTSIWKTEKEMRK